MNILNQLCYRIKLLRLRELELSKKIDNSQ